MTDNKFFKDKTVLITGGTGSFGRACAKRLISDNQCSKVVIFSRDEWKQWEMRESDPLLDDPKMRYFLGDVRDTQRMRRAFTDVDVIIHAAALKQVPAAEYNPSEFVKTNVMGAMNLIDAALERNVQTVIALSTDKSVNPINLYGATKLCSDKVFIAANSYVGKKGTPTFSVVRYGNVLGSRGSVVPYWKKLISEGADSLPITDERMTRFWITIEEAVDFVLESAKNSVGGEIFVPKIPSMRIADLAQSLAPNLPLKSIGIREGEKLHEVLISSEESHHALDCGKYYVIAPAIYAHRIKGKPVPESFSYTSDNNPEWLKPSSLNLS
jgi:UDP-N-acetylglucosamine 4,6-dehydratase